MGRMRTSALVDIEQTSADSFDPPDDAIAVQTSERIESFHHHERQHPLEDIRFLFHSVY